MHYEFEKHFTLEQANALIPYVRRLFAEVHSLLNAESNLDITDSDRGSVDSLLNGHENGHTNGNGAGNGNGKKKSVASQPADYTGWSEEKRHEAAYRLLNALQSQGIVIQDVERGLIDFPSIYNDREVFLCYELSDGLSIGYFHDLGAGYAGREKITEGYR